MSVGGMLVVLVLGIIGLQLVIETVRPMLPWLVALGLGFVAFRVYLIVQRRRW